MTSSNVPPAYDPDVLSGLEKSRRAGWARAYSADRAALAVLLELATCMGSNLKTGITVDNQEHIISILRWIAADPKNWSRSLNAAGLSDADLRTASDFARRAAAAIAETFNIDEAEADRRVTDAFS